MPARSRSSSSLLTPKLLEQALGKPLPAKYRAFITSGRYRKLNRHAFPELPTLSVDEVWPLVFDANTRPESRADQPKPRVLSLWGDRHVYSAAARKSKPFPLATLEGEDFDSDFVAIDLFKDPKCPVFFRTGGDGTFTKLADSLDQFVEALIAPRQPTLYTRLDRAIDKAGDLIDDERPATSRQIIKVTSEALSHLERFERVGCFVSEDTRELAAEALNYRGHAYLHLDKLDDALGDFTAGWTGGSAHAAVCLFETLIYQRRSYAAGKRIAEQVLNDAVARAALGNEHAPRVYKALGFSQLHLGDIKTATKYYKEMRSRMGDRPDDLGEAIEELRSEIDRGNRKAVAAAPTIITSLEP
ncbi:MAG: hypothetical protein AB7O24_06420 [Kofleriaceae bacterium]